MNRNLSHTPATSQAMSNAYTHKTEETCTTAVPAAQSRSSFRFYTMGFKRLLDLVLVLMVAPIVLTTVCILAFLVSLDGGQPFYFQDRIGRGGRTFRMWKLRSMVPDADERLGAYLRSDPAARQEWDRTQKLVQDPRITHLGKALRACSLDELPQLWNVLIGDMSLVGPRPMMPCQQDMYPGEAYYRLLPGVTGPWQVSARNQSTFADRAHYDDHYERSVSLATDIGLLVKTVGVLVRRTGV